MSITKCQIKRGGVVKNKKREKKTIIVVKISLFAKNMRNIQFLSE